MTNLSQAGGLPMRMALHTLATGPTAETLQLFYQHEAEPQEVLRSLVQALWSAVLFAEMEGRVRITGVLPGEKRSEILERGLLLTSTADFRGNTLSTAVGTVNGVLVHHTQPVSPQDHTQVAPAAPSMSVNPVERAAAWMKKHVVVYIANQRDDRVAECAAELSIRRSDAKAGWATLPEEIKGTSRRPK